MLQPQHRRGDLKRPRSGQADDPNPAAPGRRGDGDDGVVEVHAAIVTGKLNGNQRVEIGHPEQYRGAPTCPSLTNC
jgi:hypothetical protein